MRDTTIEGTQKTEGKTRPSSSFRYFIAALPERSNEITYLRLRGPLRLCAKWDFKSELSRGDANIRKDAAGREGRILNGRGRSPILCLRPLEEGYPNGKEAVLKTAGRKPLQVRVLSPPPVRVRNSVAYRVTLPATVAFAGSHSPREPAL